MDMLERSIKRGLKRALKLFPVAYISGARQTGKSTLVKQLQGKRFFYVSLDNIDDFATASRDPKGFVQSLKKPLIIDEVQRVPELTLVVKSEVDRQRSFGQFILTGSARLEAVRGIKDSLAGRVAIHSLHPFTISEINSKPFTNPVDDLLEYKTVSDVVENYEKRKIDIDADTLLKGGFPLPAYDLKNHDERKMWFRQYRETYIQRDVRDLLSIQDIPSFARFLELVSYSSGGILNYSDLSRDAGVSVDTAKRWLNVLELTFISSRLYPYWSNVRTRLSKSPKVYINDSGLFWNILGLGTEVALSNHKIVGQLFETWVFSQFSAMASYSDDPPSLYFYRTHGGVEVDFILERKNVIIPIEVKSSSFISSTDIRPITSAMETLGPRSRFGVIIYRGDVIRTFGKVVALPVNNFFGV